MWQRIAALWHCPVSEAQARCTSKEEFVYWCAYWNVEPWGAPMFDRLFANLAMHLDDKPGTRKLVEYLCMTEVKAAPVSLPDRKRQANAFFGS